MNVDICVGLAWGDEAKGKIVASLSKSGHYDYICRWAGGCNAGHTIYIKDKKYITHLIPCGIFFNIKCIIGPDCVINIEKFKEEIVYLTKHGFNTNLIKVSPKCHIVQDKHIQEDIEAKKIMGTTGQGIGQCYRDKFARSGIRAESVPFFKDYLWDGHLGGNILCEGAQGFWLDINYGNYPYVTSSTTLPYGACSLGFPPKLINHIYGAAKIYDTRSGIDPDFPLSLMDDPELRCIGELGEEYGSTTGRPRIVNWLNITKLITAINISGANSIIFSKVDILEKIDIYKCIKNNSIISFETMDDMKKTISNIITTECPYVYSIKYSDSPHNMDISKFL